MNKFTRKGQGKPSTKERRAGATFGEGKIAAMASEFLSKLTQLGKDTDQKMHNLVNWTNSQMQQIYKVFGELTGSLDLHDMNIMVLSKMLRDLYGHLAQIDVYLKKLDVQDLSVEEKETLRESAEAWYKESMERGFKEVHEDRLRQEEMHKKSLEAAEAAKAQAEQDKLDVEEQSRIEAECRTAEEPSLITDGGPGADIPQGADVFSG